MAAFIATYPPIGQVTRLQDSNVTFHAVLDVPRELSTEPWQLSLWHSNGDGQQWTEAEFLPCPPNLRPSDLDGANETTARLYFTADVPVESSLSFTVKFRQGQDHAWRWIRDELGLDDGVVVFDQGPASEAERDDLPDLIQDLNPNLKWKDHMSQSPGTRLWSIEAGVDAAKGDESAYANHSVGIPWGGFLK